MCEVNDKFKWFVIERLQRQQDMIYQQVTIDLTNSIETKNNTYYLK